ncbi:MAG: ABC transporter ATP-binding protein/permease [Beijerinckiaceae bacterium]|nr:ABC transporter ATP-binding protein/permease [Beijerinckiaceae bacterium]
MRGTLQTKRQAPVNPSQEGGIAGTTPLADASSAIDRATVARFNRFTTGFWQGPANRIAWWLTFGLAGFLILKLCVDVALNRWNRWFFDALERHDAASAGFAALAFVVLVFCIAAVGVGIVRTRETLQVRWREWCTAKLLDRWIANQRFYRMVVSPTGMANPEYRISDDVRMATEPLVDFAIGLFTAVLSASTFVVILWSVGGSLNVTILGAQVYVPAFMVVGALVYGIAVSSFMPIVGRRLSGAAAAKNEAEARFRFEMIRLRENAEAVVLSQGEANARQRLDRTYSGLVSDWLYVVSQHARVTWLMNANSSLVPVVPLVLAAPKYLSGELSLGEVMQLASAFAQVQIAIGWLVDNYWRVAEWFASARRVVELIDAFEETDASAAGHAPLLDMQPSPDAKVHLTSLRLTDASGRSVIESADAAFAPGDRVWLTGEAGTGKSTLLRALVGLWQWGDGKILLPVDRQLIFLPSIPILPAGKLEDALLYPLPSGARTRGDIVSALHACGAGHLTRRLDETARWEQALSGGEKQRLAFARVLAMKPQIVVLEDSLSGFDDQTQINLFRTLADQLPSATIITVGGSSTLARHHTRCFQLVRDPLGSVRLVELEHESLGSRNLHSVMQNAEVTTGERHG